MIVVLLPMACETERIIFQGCLLYDLQIHRRPKVTAVLSKYKYTPAPRPKSDVTINYIISGTAREYRLRDQRHSWQSKDQERRIFR